MKKERYIMILVVTSLLSCSVFRDHPVTVPPVSTRCNYTIHLTTRHKPALAEVSKVVNIPGAVLRSTQEKPGKPVMMTITLFNESHETVNGLLLEIYKIRRVKFKLVETAQL